MLWLALASATHAAEADVRLGIGLPDVAHVQVGFPLSERWDGYGRLGTNLGLISYVGASVTLEVPPERFRLEPATPIVPLQVGMRFGSR